jgi:hypothetical protein
MKPNTPMTKKILSDRFLKKKWLGGLLTIISIFFFINFSSGQNTDSILISKKSHHVLIGTSVLHGSENNISAAISHGLGLADIKSSNCMSSDEHLPPTQINTITVIDDSLLIIEMQRSANCSHDFLGEILIVEDSIISLKAYSYGGYASCGCCFGLTYTIKIYSLQNFAPDKVRFVMIEDWKNTLKPITWNKK